MLAGRIGGLRCGGPLFDWQWLRVEMPIISYHPPSHGRGMPEGQGVGRRRKRAKPTSGATRHLLPEEGGRNRMSNPSTPFPWKGDARRAGGWPKAKESEANLRRYAPPPSRGRRENAAFPASSFRAEARNLFRSRSDKHCEEEDHGKHRTSYDLGGRREYAAFPHRHSRLLTTSFFWMSQAGIIAASVPITVIKGMIRSPRGSGAVSITTAA